MKVLDIIQLYNWFLCIECWHLFKLLRWRAGEVCYQITKLLALKALDHLAAESPGPGKLCFLIMDKGIQDPQGERLPNKVSKLWAGVLEA